MIATSSNGEGLMQRFEAFERRRVFAKQRVVLLEDLGKMLLDGKGSITKVLTAMASRTPDAALSDAYTLIRQDVDTGKPLHEALEPYYRPIENMLIASINVNAKSDRERGEGFITVSQMIRYLELANEGLSSVFMAILKGIALIAFAWSIALDTAKGFQELAGRKTWYPVSRVVVEVGEALFSVWPLTAGIMVGLAILIWWLLPNWVGKNRKWADQHVPGFGLYRAIRSMPIQLALGTFLAAKIGFDKALDQLILRANPWERMYLQQMKDNLKSESGVGIVDVGLFDWQSMVRVEVRSVGKDLDEALQTVAVENAPDLSKRLAKQLNLAVLSITTAQQFILAAIVLSVVLIYVSTSTRGTF